MAIITKLTQAGGRTTSSLSGRIVFDESRGKIAVTEEGGQERTRMDLLGLTTIRSDGTYANRVGQASSDLRDGMWSAKPSEDLRDLGIG